MRQQGLTKVWAGVCFFIGALVLTGGGPVWSAAAQECSQSTNWTWMNGATTTGQTGTYGTLGVAAAGNTPGARYYAVTWTDASGKQWLFGGYNGSGYFNDLWKYDPATGYWAWMKGASTTNQVAIYGTLGTPAAANTPGARYKAVSWIDASGNLWLFGGFGYVASGTAYLNDLWKYDLSTGYWTWMKGSSAGGQTGVYGSIGVPAAGNTPGGRRYSVTWTGASGALWLFGGDNAGTLYNDLWSYDTAAGNWTWVKGSSSTNQVGIYGTLGTPAVANTPGARGQMVSWVDASGSPWIFGGFGISGYLNDLWKYDRVSGNWTWMKGSSSAAQTGIYGTLGTPAAANTPGARYNPVSWTDSAGKLWLFSGYNGTGSFNDLWMFDAGAGWWTWMRGASTTDQLGTYGTVGTPALANTPGARYAAASWADQSGGLWLFGGTGYPASGASGYLNDLWRYRGVAANDTIPPVITLLGANPGTVECHTIFTDAGATASDNCAGDRTAYIRVTNPVNVNVLGAYTVGYNVNDGNGNNAVEITRTVNVVDTTPPVIALLGVNPAVVGLRSPYTDAGATATDTCAGDRTAYITAINPVDVNTPGTYTVRYNVSDGNGNNAAEVTRTVTVANMTAPVITLRGNSPATVECHSSYADAGATALDGHGTDLTGSIAVTSPVNVNVPGSYTVRYNVKDGIGVSAAEVTRTVNVVDTTVPVISLAGSNTVSVECGAVYTDSGATATDTCAGNLTGAIVVTNPVNTQVLGTYTVRYNVKDPANNSAVEVTRTVVVGADRTPPVITLTGSAALTVQCKATYTDPGATATDACAGIRTVTTTGTVNTSILGTYTLSYSANDGNGNDAAQVTRTVTVVDTTAPVITLLGANPANVLYGAVYIDAGATASDACAGDRTGAIVVNNAVNTAAYGSYTVTYNVNDGNGNAATQASRTVVVAGPCAPTEWDWTWMNGARTTAQTATYGTMGMAAAGNTPGARYYAVTWTDASGKMWLLGGYNGSGYSNDLWKYDPATGYWAWMKGASTTNQVATYGTLGTPAAANTPGARYKAVSWTDVSGNLWLFGGYGYVASGLAYLNDLWKYDTASGYWTWMKGSSAGGGTGVYGSIGVPAAANTPGARDNAVTWTDASGKLWLFGGYNGSGYFNDLWKYDPATGYWAWMKGSSTTGQAGTYGTLGTPASGNTPGARGQMVAWVDASGSPWIFGGYGYSSVSSLGYLNDLWKYDRVSGNWTWVKGSSSTAQTGTYGTPGIPAVANTPGARYNSVSWTDSAGKLWLFSGYNGSGYFNDLWMFDAGAGWWTWMKGASTTNQLGTYGTLGTPALANTPGARYAAASWADASGNLWLFGGYGYAASGSGYLNDLWRLRGIASNDATAPVITLLGANSATVECHTSYTDAGATASDNCAGDRTANLVITNPVNVNVLGAYTVRYNVNDANGNNAAEVARTVNVVDTTPPVIALLGVNPAVVGLRSPYTDAGTTATDACAGDRTAYITVTNPVDVNTPGSYVVRYNVSDGNGNNAAEVTRTVTVANVPAPVITLLGTSPATVECHTSYIDAGATALDRSGNNLTGSIIVNNLVNVNVPGTYIVHYNVTDGDGVPAPELTREVNVVDTTVPVISLAGSSAVVVPCGNAYTDAGATATDTCAGNLTGAIVVTNPVNTQAPGAYTVRYNVKDPSNNSAVEVTRTVVVGADSTAPVITLTGSAAVTAQCGAAYTDAGATAADTCSGIRTVTTTGTVNTSILGTYTLSYNANDGNGNSAVQVTRTVTVVDTTAPVITRLGTTPITLEWHTPYTDAGATATDSCVGDRSAAIVVTNPVNVDTLGIYTVRYNVNDGNGNSAVEVTRKVSVLNGTKPVITLLGVNPVTVECPAPYLDAGATAIDNAGASITSRIVVSNFVNVSTAGSYTLRYNVTDTNGVIADEVTRVVNVVDTTAPVLTRLGNPAVTVECHTSYTDPGATALDACVGDRSHSIVVTNPVNLNLPGTYTVRYNVGDGNGNSAAEVTRTVTVVDTTIPVIARIGSATVTTGCHTAYTDAGATASDSCGGDLTAAIVVTNPVNVDNSGAYTVRYNLTDGSGNRAAEVTRRVNVVNAGKPVITRLGSDTVTVECHSSYTDAGATAADSCGGDLGGRLVVSNPVNVNMPWAYVVRYNVADVAGNSAVEVTRTVNVVDTVKPVITRLGSAMVTVEAGRTYTDAGATASDSCWGDRTANIATTNPVNTGVVGTYTVRYNVIDVSNNHADEVTRTVKVAAVLHVTQKNSTGPWDGHSWATAYRDIQSAVDVAGVTGGEVWVAGGTYTAATNPVVMMRPDVLLYGGFAGTESSNGERNWTANPTIIDGQNARRCVEGADTSVLDGFTVTRGRGVNGGGMYNTSSSPTVANCTFTASTATYSGSYGGGGAMYNDASSPVITNCIFLQNTATKCGGAMFNYSYANPALINCSFTLNTAASGGAVFNYSSTAAALTNCILWADTATTGPELFNYNGAALVVGWSCVQGGQAGAGNISADPVFVDAAGSNLQLQVCSSPCVDSGTATGAPDRDLRGALRLQGRGVDMGAYEATPDTTVPVLALLGTSPLTVECHSVYTDAGATASDNCADNLTGSITVTNPVNANLPGSYTVRYNVNDGHGNNAVELTRAVTVVDSTPPVITRVGGASVKAECGLAYSDAGATAADACAGDLGSALAVDNPVNVNVLGVYTVRYTVSDGNGNSAIAVTRTVTVADTTRPVITLLGADPILVECRSSYSDPGATAMDGCAGDRTASLVATNPVNVNLPGVYTVRYNVNDGNGNNAVEATRRVSVVDVGVPVITLTGASPVTVECGGTYTEPGATAADNCAGDLTANIAVTNPVNTGLPGSYRVRYNVNDGNGNNAVEVARLVNVVDSTRPVLTLLGGASVTAECGAVYSDAGAMAADVCAGDLTGNVAVDNPVNLTAPGSYTVRYSVSDGNGNSAVEVTRTVTVADTTAPVITRLGSATVTVECHTSYADAGATATDACAGDLTGNVAVDNPVNVNAPGAYTVRYNVNDGNGNNAVEVTRVVNVVDRTAPVITLLGTDSVAVECHASYHDAGATAVDTCAGDRTGGIVVSNPVNVDTPGVYTVRYNVNDGHGNSAVELTRRVRVVDSGTPVITLTGEASMTVECGGTYTVPGATAMDACAGDLTAGIQFGGDVDTAAPGTHHATYSVSDGTNTGFASRTVAVVDTVIPVITLLGSSAVVLDCGQAYNDAGATALDACSGDLTGNIALSGLPPAGPLGPGNWTVSYDVVDGSGNRADTVSRTVTVRDNCTLAVDAAGDTLVHSRMGDQVELSVTVTGAVGELSFQWRKEGATPGGKVYNPIPGATDATLVIGPVTADSAGQYVCAVSDAVTSIDGPIFTVATPDPPVPLAGLAVLATAAAALGLGGVSFIRRRKC